MISRAEDSALLGPDNEHPLLTLTGLTDPTPTPPGSTGLFHVAWLHPSRAALAETARRVVFGRWPIDGASDHGVSEALYLSDPDGLGIEIYVDRPRELWDRPPDGHGVKMVTLPLDLDESAGPGFRRGDRRDAHGHGDRARAPEGLRRSPRRRLLP